MVLLMNLDEDFIEKNDLITTLFKYKTIIKY